MPFDVVADLASDGCVALGVAGGDLGGVAGLLELLAREVGDRLQHPQTAVRLHERGVDERLELVERSLARDRLGVGERQPPAKTARRRKPRCSDSSSSE